MDVRLHPTDNVGCNYLWYLPLAHKSPYMNQSRPYHKLTKIEYSKISPLHQQLIVNITAQTVESTPDRHWPDAKVSDRCLICVDTSGLATLQQSYNHLMFFIRNPSWNNNFCVYTHGYVWKSIVSHSRNWTDKSLTVYVNVWYIWERTIGKHQPLGLFFH